MEQLISGIIFTVVAFLLVLFLSGDADTRIKTGEMKHPMLKMNKKLLNLFACHKRKDGAITLVPFIFQAVNYAALVFGIAGSIIYGLSENGVLFFIGLIIMIVLFLAAVIFYFTIRGKLRGQKFKKEMLEAEAMDAINDAASEGEAAGEGAAAGKGEATEGNDASKA